MVKNVIKNEEIFQINLQLFAEDGTMDMSEGADTESVDTDYDEVGSDEDTSEDDVVDESDGIEEDVDDGIEEDVDDGVEEAAQKDVNVEEYFQKFLGAMPQANNAPPVPNSNDPVDMLKHYIQQQVSPFQQQARDMELRLEVARLATTHKDFSAYAERAVEVLKDNPELLRLKSPLETAYKLAKADGMDNLVSTARQQGKNDAYKGQARKRAAFVEGSQTKRTSSGNKTIEDTIADNIVAASRRRL